MDNGAKYGLDSPKTKLLKTKIVDFSYQQQTLFNQGIYIYIYIYKYKMMISFLLKDPNNNNIISVISISPTYPEH